MAAKNRIKCLREFKRMTQKDLAELLNVNPSAVSHWEIGANEIRNDYLEKIAKFFSVPVSFVIGDEYKLKRPFDMWHEDEKEDYRHAKDEKDYLEFKYGQGYFGKLEKAAFSLELVTEDEHKKNDHLAKMVNRMQSDDRFYNAVYRLYLLGENKFDAIESVLLSYEE